MVLAEADVRQRFDALYLAHDSGVTRQRIWREVFGDEYPVEVDPNSYVTRSDLRRIAQELRVGPGQTFVDLACGRGGPGLWIARASGAGLVGIDLSPVAVALAARRSGEFGLTGRTRYEVGDLEATGLPGAAFDGAICVDLLVFVADKRAAVREVGRLLRPRARFVFTTWE